MYTRENLLELAAEIKEVMNARREELALTFVEDKHIYYMKNMDGDITSKYKSVSKIVKQFHPPFDSHGLSLKIAKGDRAKQQNYLLSGHRLALIQLISEVGFTMSWRR